MKQNNLNHLTYLGVGSRDGDRIRAMAGAAGLLSEMGATIMRASSLYETEPVDLHGDRTLLNGVLQVSTHLEPEALFQACRRIESRLGRCRQELPSAAPDPGPRPIDLDILLYDDQVLNTATLTLPHPRMHLRRFVLVPMQEIASQARHPVLGLEMEALLDRCTDRSRVSLAHPATSWWKPASQAGR